VSDLHLLKLETGVEISTLFVRIVGREGKAVNKSRRIAAATPNSKSFCLPMARSCCYLLRMRMIETSSLRARRGRADSEVLAP